MLYNISSHVPFVTALLEQNCKNQCSLLQYNIAVSNTEVKIILKPARHIALYDVDMVVHRVAIGNIIELLNTYFDEKVKYVYDDSMKTCEVTMSKNIKMLPIQQQSAFNFTINSSSTSNIDMYDNAVNILNSAIELQKGATHYLTNDNVKSAVNSISKKLKKMLTVVHFVPLIDSNNNVRKAIPDDIYVMMSDGNIVATMSMKTKLVEIVEN